MRVCRRNAAAGRDIGPAVQALNATRKPRTPGRAPNRTAFPHAKARPVPGKSATKEEQEKFARETNEELRLLKAEGYAIPRGDEAGAPRCSGGGCGWRRAGGRDAAKTTFSIRSVKPFGAPGKDGFHAWPADAPNSDTFTECLEEPRQIRTKFVMILDNAAYRKSKAAARFMESTGGDIKLMYLPSRTPQLNPIGVQRKALKRLLAGRYFETADEPRDAIMQIAQNEMKPVEVDGCVTQRPRTAERPARTAVPAPSRNMVRCCRPCGRNLEQTSAMRAILGRLFAIVQPLRQDRTESGPASERIAMSATMHLLVAPALLLFPHAITICVADTVIRDSVLACCEPDLIVWIVICYALLRAGIRTIKLIKLFILRMRTSADR